MLRLRLFRIAVMLLTVNAIGAPAESSTTIVSSVQPPGTIHKSLLNEVDATINRGLDWLIAHQNKDGSWSNPSFPALTALPARALLQGRTPAAGAAVDKGIKHILTAVNDDGGIYKHVPGRKGGGLSNYNTAICISTLHASGRKSLTGVILNARKFLAGAQHFGDDVYNGGFGYDRQTKRAYTDLLNTYYTVTAMRETQGIEDLRDKSEKRVDINWNKTLKFVERMQNKPDTTADDAGGFVYNPTDPKAGTTTNAAGVVVFRSYGSITYAGMLALMYAEVSRDDPRVQSAFDWASRHWSLDENPGMGPEGLYFFYNVLTRALSATGHDLVPLTDGSFVNWKAEVAKKLVATQVIDPDTGQGYWVNKTGRYWENDPILVTSYSLLALQMLVE